MHWLKNLKACLPARHKEGQAGLSVDNQDRQGQVRFKEPLGGHTTLRIGGPADVWAEPNNAAKLREIVCRCFKERIPYLVIGRGSNILFSDKGFKGVVVCLNSAAFTKMEVREKRVFCGAGLSLNTLLKAAQKKGLGGLEFLAGIPASVGGALVMNAGIRQKAIGSLLEAVTVMDKQGKMRVLKNRWLKFAYRQSSLNRYIVLKAQLLLIKRNPEKIKENIAMFLQQRRKTQDLTSKSAGCIFKNSRHLLSAGQMIEACGLKRRRKGGAEISAKHANYFINRNGATAKDILYLMRLAQEKVQKKFGVDLEPEIKIVK